VGGGPRAGRLAEGGSLREENGNPFFQGRGWVFVALRPEPKNGDEDWRLWIKKPREDDGYRACGRFASFEALRQTVETALPTLTT
jgi:hypothetical protein